MNPDFYLAPISKLDEAIGVYNSMSAPSLFLDAAELVSVADPDFSAMLKKAADEAATAIMNGDFMASTNVINSMRRAAADRHIALQTRGSLPVPAPSISSTSDLNVMQKVTTVSPGFDNELFTFTGATDVNQEATRFGIGGILRGLGSAVGTVIGGPAVGAAIGGLLGGGSSSGAGSLVPTITGAPQFQLPQGTDPSVIQQILAVLGAGAGQTPIGAAGQEAIRQLFGPTQPTAPAAPPVTGPMVSGSMSMPVITAPQSAQRLKAPRGYRIVTVPFGHPGYNDAKRAGGVLQADGSVKIAMLPEVARKFKLLPPTRRGGITAAQVAQAKKASRLDKKIKRLAADLGVQVTASDIKKAKHC